MGIAILIVAVLAIAGAVVWFFIKNRKEEPSVQSEKPSEPSTPPVVEVPTNEEKESEEPIMEAWRKFEAGDWVVVDGVVQKVRKVSENGFDTDSWWHGKNTFKDAHLWTIQDAKDGDVLCCESGWTCIFKALNSDISFSSYCFMDDTGWFCETGSESHTLDKAFIKAYNGNIYPATKEQCELLFKKMKEAGYMWNPDTKELKEIEQPSVEVPTEEPKEEPKDEEPVLGNPEPTIKETPKKSLGECLDAFKEYVLIPDCSVVKGFLEAIYMEASYQFGLESCNGLPLLYKKENFHNVYDIYGGKRDEGAAFNSMMGWMFALLLMELKPKKRNQIGKIGYELGGYDYNSPTFGYEFKSCPNTARLVGSMVLAAMLGKKNPDLRVMSNEVGGTAYPDGLSYYLDQGLNHLKTADDIQKNVVSKSGFYLDFRQFLPSSAGPYDAKYKNRPANIMSDAKDEYLNNEMDRKIHEFIVETYNLDNPDPEIHQHVVQAIADKEQSVNHLFGSNKKVGEYEFHCVFGKDTIGRKIKADGGVANLAWSIQAIATYFRLVLQNKVDNPAYYGRLRPGCDWTEEKKKNSSTDDRRNILVDITIEDNDGEKESSFGYYNSDGIWVHTQVERDKFSEEQKNHLGANSYPSGHSSGIWCVAMTLAELMPDKADLIMREANEFAINRTVTRFHWTSDTIFGRVLGSVANAMCHATTDYTTLLKIARKEIS